MKKHESVRKNFIKGQMSQETKRQKTKRPQSRSPIEKPFSMNYLNKENNHPNQKPTIECYKKQYLKIKNQMNDREYEKYSHYGKPQVKQMRQMRQVDVIVCRSLEKCQLPHSNHTPKSCYLVKGRNNEFLVCEGCGSKYDEKTPIKEIKEKEIGGRRIGEFMQKLSENEKKLLIFEENARKYMVKYREFANIEKLKHRQYYNSIFQILEEAMSKSELTLRERVYEVQQIFQQKIEEIKKDKQRIKDMLSSLSTIIIGAQSQFYNYKQLIKLMNVSENHHLYLPFLSLNTNSKLIEDFKRNFNKKYILQIVNEKEISEKEEVKKNKQIFDDYYSKNSSDYYQNQPKSYSNSRSRSNNMIHSYNNSYDDTQLYCDEALGPSANSVNNFSFEGENENKASIVPIIQLTEQQDIISPNFKQF